MGKKRTVDSDTIKKSEGSYFGMKCNRCENIWYTKNDSVMTCPNGKCKSPYWKYLRIR